MNRKIGNAIFNTTLLTLMFLIGLSSISNFTGYGYCIFIFPAIIIHFLFIPGDSFSRYYIFLIFLFCVILAAVGVTLLYTANVSAPFIPFEKNTVSSITGRVLYDSSFTKSGGHLITLVLKNCHAEKTGLSGTASGIITCIGKEEAIITSGIKARLTGSFTENGLFIYKSLQVLERSKINDFREYLITKIEKLILNGDIRESEILSMMLLLGRAETYGSKIKELASKCGSLHILALSGMHLHAVTAITKVIKNKIIRYILSAILVTAFIFIAGPRPSLVRSGIMVLFGFLPIKERFLVSLIVQLAVFPLSFANIGLVYALLAVGAIILFSERLYGPSLINTSLSVLCLTAPLSLHFNGVWYPAVIIAGPAASLLAMCSMTTGFFLCVTSLVQAAFGAATPFTALFGRLRTALLFLNEHIFRFLTVLFEKCAKLPVLHRTGYLILCLVSVFLLILPSFLQKRNAKKALKGLQISW